MSRSPAPLSLRERPRRRSWLIGGLLALASAGCSLLVELSGLSGGATDAGTAENDASIPADASTAEDASTDAAAIDGGDAAFDGPTIILDTFSRTVSGGFGAGEVGGPWTRRGGSADAYNVYDGGGVFSVTPGSGLHAQLQEANVRDFELTMRILVDAMPGGSGVYVTIFTRTQRVSGFRYGLAVRVAETGSIAPTFNKSDGGGDFNMDAGGNLSSTYGVGDAILVRLQMRGSSPTTMRAKVWLEGEPEPGEWNVGSGDDTPELQDGGIVGVNAYLSASATTPINVIIDDVVVRALSP